MWNWNVVIKALATVGIEVDADTKSLIVAGDNEMVVEVLSQIHAAESEVRS